MLLDDLARKGAFLTGITMRGPVGMRPDTLILDFEDAPQVAFTVDCDWDEFIFGLTEPATIPAIDPDCPVYLQAVPLLGPSGKMSLIWCWLMKNHQGYTDALQLELWDKDTKQELILQFKVAASGIDVFNVARMDRPTT
jgi:hypothetical protein